MKKSLLLVTAALAILAGCNRSGMIDATGSASTSASSNSSGNSGSNYHKNSTPDRIAHGREVVLEQYIVPGKTTIFDFTSEGCPPCRAIAPHLHKLHADRADIVVVEIDLNRPGVGGIDWDSPVAQQFRLPSIPAFKIYGPNGKLQAEGEDATKFVYNLIR